MRDLLECMSTGMRCLEQTGLRAGENEAPLPAPYDPTQYVTVRVWEEGQHSSMSLVDNGNPLRQQAIACAQRDVSGDPTYCRVYIADETSFRLVELHDTLTLAAIRARGGVHPGTVLGTYLPLDGQLAVHVFTYAPENERSLYNVRHTNLYW
jgi:hypothetical protein